MSERLFVVDESGHAGGNYADAEQPFHVAAGWLFAVAELERVRELLFKHANTKGVALKAAKRLHSAAGRKHVRALFDELGAMRAMPFYIVMERRFALVGKIVDVFLDPEHHAGAAWLSTSDVKLRKKLTERLLSELPESLLLLFAQAYGVPTVEGFSQFLQALIVERRARGDALSVRSFESALASVGTIVEYEDYAGDHGGHASMAALNVPALTHLLRMVDRYAEYRGERYRVVHDRSDQFRKAMELTVKSMARPTDQPDVRYLDGTLLRTALVQLDGFETKERHEEPLLEAADTLASTVGHLCKKAQLPKALRESLFEDLAQRTFLTSLQEEVPLFAGAYASEDAIARCVTAAMGYELPPRATRRG